MSRVEASSLSIDLPMGRAERFPALAAELVRLNVDVIVTRGTPSALAAWNTTKTFPSRPAGANYKFWHDIKHLVAGGEALRACRSTIRRSRPWCSRGHPATCQVKNSQSGGETPS
jgi:hypothetical protein